MYSLSGSIQRRANGKWETAHRPQVEADMQRAAHTTVDDSQLPFQGKFYRVAK